MDKDQWDTLHTVFGLLMILFGIWHVILNWKAIVKYFASKEFFITTVAVLLITVGSVANVPPFKTIMDAGEKIKKSWPRPKVMLPAPHAELFPLKKVAKLAGVPPQKALSILRSKGLKVDSLNETLKEIAAKNDTTPARVYKLLIRAK